MLAASSTVPAYGSPRDVRTFSQFQLFLNVFISKTNARERVNNLLTTAYLDTAQQVRRLLRIPPFLTRFKTDGILPGNDRRQAHTREVLLRRRSLDAREAPGRRSLADAFFPSENFLLNLVLTFPDLLGPLHPLDMILESLRCLRLHSKVPLLSLFAHLRL
jgi:hypothetical protein